MQRLRDAAGRIARPGLVMAYRLRPGAFTFAGAEYRYFAHPYNETWRNERAVELPIVLRALDERPGARVLEVGNVLAHYGRSGHDVIDKYEAAPGVRGIDVVDLDPSEPYDLIVAISTLEHVGLDEDVRDPAKPRRAAERMASALAPGGMVLVTVPLGYNKDLDRDLREGRIGFDEVGFLRRIAVTRWVEAAASEATDIAYGTPYECANGLAICVLRAD